MLSYSRLILVGFLALGAGCSSVPIRYYTLTSPPGKSLRAAEADFPTDVRVVHIPAQLRRSELMLRTGTTEMTILDNERWTSPLNDEIKESLRLQLERALGRTSESRPTFARLALDIDVQHFEAQLGRYALLEASWSANFAAAGPQSDAVRFAGCAFRTEEKISPGYAGVVEGYQRAIAAFADAIATTLARRTSSVGASCQPVVEGSTGGADSSVH